jgi:hypothetical protein
MNVKNAILIVCEGDRSEPNYFHKLREQILDKCADNTSIKILPIPPEEQIEEDLNNFKVRKAGKKRQLIDISTIENNQIEDEYKAQPICYVRKAQLEQLQSKGLYDEIWVVYDKDGHPKQFEAFELSKKEDDYGKIINIAFSSISFEVWILMHFEKVIISHLKSQCKLSKKKTIDCGTHNEENDCSGEKCVCGYIVENKYLKYEKGKNFNFEMYDPYWQIALLNATKIREENKVNLATFYNINPFTTLDRLVLKLKYLCILNLEWKYTNIINLEKNISIQVFFNDNKINFKIKNNSNQIYIIEKDRFFLMNYELDRKEGNERVVLDIGEEKPIEFSILIDDFTYVIFKKNEIDAFIIDKSVI